MRIFLSTLGVFFLMSFLFIMPAVLGPSTTPQPSASPVLSAAPTPSPAAAQEIRAVWVSFLEWQHTDFSSESAFRADAAAIMQNIASLGANTVFAHVRPFGDALYPSRYFPFSHLCTGTQGQDPGFDPLAVLVETAHAQGLTLEAWINPYRLQANFDKAVAENGLEAYFDSPARQLIRGEDGRVTGVIFQSLTDDSYTQVNASKGVILATGGFGHNDAMMAYYLPWIHDIIDRYDVTYGHTDIKANYANTGDGQQMGMWIGAQMEPGPPGSMAHGDFGKLGPDAFLQLNAQGIRFHNEDQTNDHYGAQFVRQPGPIYMVIDSDWAEQLPAMQGGLGCVRSASDTLKESIDEWTAGKGDTIEELADALGLDADAKANFVASVERYNELCDKGVDEDFGKSPLRMFALRKAPFYAIKDEGSLRFLVTLGGLRTNANAQVLDNSFQVIPGLYAIGNTQGGRFVGDYPTTIAGASHSIACTYGYLTGKFIAEQG